MSRQGWIGQRFGKLVVTSIDTEHGSRLRVLCRCDCGAAKPVRLAHLRTGATASCGCLTSIKRDTRFIGKRFGRLVLQEFVERRKRETYWLAQCDCGKRIRCSVRAVRTGHTRSCGCLRTELSHARMRNHGMAGTPTYEVWCGMNWRCGNAEDPDYGGRGIAVCDRWRDSFENFLTDMGERPNGMTIDRYPNNDGNYEPGNCRWATAKQQANNRRTNHRVEVNGRSATFAEWESITGISQDVIRHRIVVLGWEPHDAISRATRVTA